jgi:hypothetical protein
LSAKKSAQKRRQRSRTASKIHIKEEIQRWNRLKDKNNLKTHADMAKYLLDLYVNVKRTS